MTGTWESPGLGRWEGLGGPVTPSDTAAAQHLVLVRINTYLVQFAVNAVPTYVLLGEEHGKDKWVRWEWGDW